MAPTADYNSFHQKRHSLVRKVTYVSPLVEGFAKRHDKRGFQLTLTHFLLIVLLLLHSLPQLWQHHANTESVAPPSHALLNKIGTPLQPPHTWGPNTASLPPWGTDELICPLAPSSAPLPPSTFVSHAPPTDEDVELQAMLTRSTFLTSRKHRRSGESVDYSSAGVNATVPGTTTSTDSRHGTGPVCAWFSLIRLSC